jgi:membrane-bound lytic murein transglycosylase B
MRILRRVVLIVVASVGGLALLAAIIFLAVPGAQKYVPGLQATTVRFATAAPVTAAAHPAGVGIAVLADPVWIAKTAAATGIPSRALEAYAGAAINQDVGSTCGMGWNTLAGIGEVESRHGTIFGGTLAADGAATPPIFGVTLDGTSTAHVPDTDRGAIDGDPTGDRAVGPMQLIPEAWRNWHTDGSGDGREDPQNIDDSALAASHYLCRAGKDLSTETGWRTAVLAYNHSDQYLTDIIRYATLYATEATAG